MTVALLAAVLTIGGALLLPGSLYLLLAGIVASGVGAFLAGRWKNDHQAAAAPR